MSKKPLRLGEPGSPDGPPIWTVPERTLAFRTGYWIALCTLWGLLVVLGLTIGIIFTHLAF